MGANAVESVQLHVSRAKQLRKFIRSLNASQKEFLNAVMRHALALQALAQQSGGDFDETDSYWRKVTALRTSSGRNDASTQSCTSPICGAVLRATKEIAAIGPDGYLGFNSLESILVSLNNFLGFASEMVCLRCYKKGDFSSSSDRQSFRRKYIEDLMNANLTGTTTGKMVAEESTSSLATLSVRISSQRGFKQNVRVRVTVQGTEKPSPSGGVLPESFKFGLERKLDPNAVVKIDVLSRFRGRLMGTWSAKVVSLLEKHKRKAFWITLDNPKGNEHESQMLSVSFSFSNMGRLLEGFSQNIFPEGCGMPSAVRALVNGIENQFPSIERRLIQNSVALECAAESVQGDDFSSSQDCAPESSEAVRPDMMGRDAADHVPLVPIEGSLRANVFGGIFSPEIASVSLFVDRSDGSEGGDDPEGLTSFFSSPQFHRAMYRAAELATATS